MIETFIPQRLLRENSLANGNEEDTLPLGVLVAPRGHSAASFSKYFTSPRCSASPMKLWLPTTEGKLLCLVCEGQRMLETRAGSEWLSDLT